ncbi:MAG: hypothetical protein GTO24_21005 [candidate division Zixibacteria bacterium]|nr:hypothetical protein [candidate division Zixibacteria bacterium]
MEKVKRFLRGALTGIGLIFAFHYLYQAFFGLIDFINTTFVPWYAGLDVSQAHKDIFIACLLLGLVLGICNAFGLFDV